MGGCMRDFNSRSQIALLGLSIALLGARAGNGQACKGNLRVGCLSPGAPCSPVTSGQGQGHCTTPAGLPAGEKECDCVGTPPPPIDPRCSDRTAKGKFSCTINEPVVTKHETEYPAIVFAAGDIVEVTADGCVQTGGRGRTWKRYVNPAGPNSDRLYHGLVRIPTGTANSALVQIKSVIGRQLKVSGVDVPESQLVLHLGYEDDNYSDNGYYAHDDGEPEQCKTSFKGPDGGPAHVTITIYRGTDAGHGNNSPFDFDVLSSQTADPNGLPYNPHWSWQQRAENRGQAPDTSLCHNFSRRDSHFGVPDLFMSPYFPDCSDQIDANSVDLPRGVNAAVCKVGTKPVVGDSFAGHVNWFPVTLEGRASWGDHGSDDDYTFTFYSDDPDKPLLVNGQDGIHVEFDSDETIDHFKTEAWAAFHNAVDLNKDFAKQLFDGHTILTGMFSLDSEHRLKSELHPLYAMATRSENFGTNPGDETWLIFVRNQGDEGYCSNEIWGAGFEDYTFRLPWRPGMTSVEVNSTKTQFDGTERTSGPFVSYVTPRDAKRDLPAGVYVNFHLGPPVLNTAIVGTPASEPFINGALHLIWKGPGVGTATQTTSRGRPSNSDPAAKASSKEVAEVADEAEHKLRAAIDQLPAGKRKQVEQARIIPGTKAVVVRRLPSTGPAKKATQPPIAKLQSAKPHAISLGPATQKIQRDTAQMRALCAATANKPAGLSPEACK